jgi:uncharacterized protein GlcG (DUF336 family)
LIRLAQAAAIIDAAFAEAARLGLKPMSVAVLDAGSNLIAFQRQDGSSTLRPDIAIGKAAGALAMGMSSRKLADMAAERPTFIGALTTIAPNGLIPAAGGVIVVDADGVPIGAVGVTGDLSDKDEACALAGIAAAGLRAQP